MTNFQKKTNPYGSLKYQMRTNIYMKRFNVFLTPYLGDSTISTYLGKTPSSTEWLLNPVNKGKYKRNVFVSYLSCLFFSIILFGTFLGMALHRLNNVGVKYNITKIWSQISNANMTNVIPTLPTKYQHNQRNTNATKVIPT